ncbi:MULTISPECIES: hypothetical protein [Stappiaceae]|jgi:hypothetical protein|uniref:Uncharacterized protein n=2 Tax=Roseibium TaxID=150830 RepID=A0A0M6Y091_9HYPH|nr:MULTISPECIES: hypothetical protein [Stappiaceae]MCR9282981.1 hypothetical protein [Paracoccaceae bacterium]MEC9401358.1 hypothetical protein [Pseudomonadota bacterium]AMN53380.1 hypothetical protein ACP90_14135 [Labrenzia sp. CP4]ERP97938.1 hypothetical protein Q669_22310 [Labrenzia sp. C1B10]ERS01730.1 hypothetical protein Q675_06425 [Labrenzia sp. C1B70]
MHDMPEGNGTKPSPLECDRQRQEAIASALTEFIEDLKLVDVVDFVAYIRTDQHGNIDELIKTSAELFFKEGSLRYSMAAQADVEWETTPRISLDLEFFNKGVWIYFTAVLAWPDNAVNVSYVEVPDAGGNKAKETELLLEALKDARLR